MNKCTSAGLTPSQARKRKWDGLSTSRAMLDKMAVPPGSAQGMRAWNANAEKPRVARQSVIPLKPEPATSTVQQELHVLDEASSMPTAGPIRRRKRGRKRENDSVSPWSASLSAGSIICIVDKNAELGQTSGADS